MIGTSKRAARKCSDVPRGRFCTTLLFSAKASGRPLLSIVTDGQAPHISRVKEPVERLRAKAAIPLRSDREVEDGYSRLPYLTRNVAEHLFNRIKYFRRVSTRCDKLAGR